MAAELTTTYTRQEATRSTFSPSEDTQGKPTGNKPKATGKPIVVSPIKRKLSR